MGFLNFENSNVRDSCTCLYKRVRDCMCKYVFSVFGISVTGSLCVQYLFDFPTVLVGA